MSLSPGSSLGPYEILGSLGAGGMGEVYKARDARLERFVAVKVLPDHLARSPEALARFEREAKAVAALNHPNIMGIFDVGRAGDTAYAVMELLEGQTLRARLDEGPLPPRQATELAIQIAHGLAAAHEKGLVHRDLKPANLWITKEGRMKILDFGLAKTLPAKAETSDSSMATEAYRPAELTQQGMVLGTLGYMSPEQVRGEPVDARSDLFSFGAVLFEMLTAQRAFSRASTADTMVAILREEPPVLNEASQPIPAGLRRVLDHCLEKLPARRFHNAADLAFALESALETPSGTGQRAAGRDRAALPRPAFRRLKVPAVLALVLAVGLGVGHLTGGGRASGPLTFKPLSMDGEIVGSARFARHGQSVIFTTASKDRVEKKIWNADLGSPVLHPLLGPDAWLLAISARDELAVLTGMKVNMSLDVPCGTLGRCPPAGALPQLIAKDIVDADWAPDGTLALIRRTGAGNDAFYGCQVEYPIGHPLLVEPNGWLKHLRFSPDGQRLAVARHPMGSDDLGLVTVVDVKTGQARDLTPTWESLEGLAWQPGGREIWFTACEDGELQELCAVDLKGKVRRIYNAPMGLFLHDLSADGRALISTNDRGVRVLVSRTGDTAVRSLNLGSWCLPKDLSPDGRWAVIDDESVGKGPEYPLYLRPTDGSLPTSLGQGLGVRFSWDGQRLCIWRLRDGRRQPSVLSLSGGEEAWPVGDLEVPVDPAFSWTPGGELLVYARAKGQPLRLWRLRKEGPEPVDCAVPDDIQAFAVPDKAGDRLFFRRSGQPWAVQSLRAPGGPAQPCAGTLAGDYFLGFTADAAVMYMGAANRSEGLFKVDLRTGRRTPLAAPRGMAFTQEVSADGRTFLGWDYPVTSRLFLVEGLR